LSISEIARKTGHRRGTMRKCLRYQVPPASKKKSKTTGKLDGYREYILGRLQEYSLSAKCIYHEI
jgi:transposase